MKKRFVIHWLMGSSEKDGKPYFVSRCGIVMSKTSSWWSGYFWTKTSAANKEVTCKNCLRRK